MEARTLPWIGGAAGGGNSAADGLEDCLGTDWEGLSAEVQENNVCSPGAMQDGLCSHLPSPLLALSLGKDKEIRIFFHTVFTALGNELF